MNGSPALSRALAMENSSMVVAQYLNMGIGRHALNFLKYAALNQPLGSVATMGRQSLSFRGHSAYGEYCEHLLMSYFGAASVESYDYSNFEGCTHVADLNQPLNSDKTYQTVIDSGTAEHVFNIPQALENMAALCAVGGQIIHVNPANNFCGHGFWQLSPELFFSFYSEQNGFTDTEVFMAKAEGDYRHWYKVSHPDSGVRAQIFSRASLSVLCRTRKKATVSQFSVQQSDYVHRWDGGKITHRGTLGKIKDAIKKSEWLTQFTFPIYQRLVATLSNRNPSLQRVRVGDLLAPYKNFIGQNAVLQMGGRRSEWLQFCATAVSRCFAPLIYLGVRFKRNRQDQEET